jgi:hypothetical protein
LLIQEEQQKGNSFSLIVVMMTFKKIMKETSKREETVILDNPRIGIGYILFLNPVGSISMGYLMQMIHQNNT